MSIRNTFKNILKKQILLLVVTGITLSNCFSTNDAIVGDKSNQIIEKTVNKTVVIENQDPNWFWKVVTIRGIFSFLRPRRPYYRSRGPDLPPSGKHPYGPYGPYRGKYRRARRRMRRMRGTGRTQTWILSRHGAR